ncbi:hypothetical protein LX87_00437 [Larkinella arboricola]|uniref:Uncharacterized protein n=1 Tax=Larkinella arboricola TaxID=643671 RepID=A0A327X5K8_LARAB|nr:hypothetical protein [Larkinella arboricola]RAK02317.1 hypothetical protein LX87_00437 [Larkinella arboricola]
MKRFVLVTSMLLVCLSGWSQDLDWGDYPEGEYSYTFTNIGNIPVDATVTLSGMVESFYTDYPRPTARGLELNNNFPTNGNSVSLRVTFSQPVSNLSFNLLDIDRIDGDSQYQDLVTVIGGNLGTPVTPTIGTASTNTVTGNAILGTNSVEDYATNSISFSTPVTEVTIQYFAGPDWEDPKRQFIFITNFGWDDAGLPVRLVDFGGTSVANQVRLGWQTSYEQNSDYFTIERSPDARAFEAIGRVSSKGFSERLQTYGFSDPAPLKGTNYYRLRQVDRDGTYAYSKIVAVGYDTEGFYFQVVVLDQGRLQVETNAPDPVFGLVDVRGLPSLRQVEQVGANKYLLQVSPTGLVSSGLRIVQMRAGNFSYAKKVLIN